MIPCQTEREIEVERLRSQIATLEQLLSVHEETALEQTRRLQQKTGEISQLNAELEERVQSRTAELQATLSELQAFSYSVSHDLRSPLRSLDGYSQALMEDYGGKLDEQGQFFLERIRANAQKMAELIDSLLILSRVTRADIRPVRLDLSALAQQIVSSLRAADPQRRVECVIANGMQAYGDPKLLEVALQNLLQNSWKFTSKREAARIEIGVRDMDGANVCYVRDNGAGFDMKYASKLFLAFQRLHDVQQFEGTGIGLATVQRIIKRHGGRIWAEGQPENGACFYFTLNGLDKVGTEAKTV